MESVNTQNDYKTTCKKCTDKKKTDLSFVFSKSLNSKENSKKKTFLGKATGHNDHYMIDMGGQRQKIDSNGLLTGPSLQGCII